MSFALFQKPAFRYALSGFITAVVGFGVYSAGVPVAREFADSFAMKEFKQYGVIGTYRKHFFTFIEKFEGLAALESENEILKAQIAELEKKQTLAEAGLAERELASMNEVLEKKVKEETGSPEALLPQTIGYEVPTHLMPSELYPLALAYFRKQEFEKTVAIFDHLFRLPEERRYETAENYLMSGISWYHLKNYALSRKQVEEAKRRSPPSKTVHRQAMLWEAMLENAEGKDAVAQTKLLHFIGEYPHSEEGLLINGGRKPAAHTESKVEAKASEAAKSTQANEKSEATDAK